MGGKSSTKYFKRIEKYRKSRKPCPSDREISEYFRYVSSMRKSHTLGKLKKSGWLSRTVKQEIRENAIRLIREGEDIFPTVLGYQDTVIPQVENAVLAGHDVIFLGERGQAKTRMIRGLVELLDEWMPIIAGSEINDDPFNPISKHARDLISEKGDGTPIEWIHRNQRFGEKLATPDTSIADLIGEVDPIKVAEGRYLSDELTLHYGLVPRTNRGIFAINELPDLSERIQVGLLNILEERDVQIRGYKVRLPLDVILVASANPEDYTNRGRIITPLKDRFGSQIRTHYPFDIELERQIAVQEANTFPHESVNVDIPEFMEKIIATLSHVARENPNINQRSGVSVRLTVSNYETLIAGSLRRALLNEETYAVPRVSDLSSLVASTSGKIEIETLEDGRETEIIRHLIKQSVLEVFREAVDHTLCSPLLDEFENGAVVSAGDDISSTSYIGYLNKMEPFKPILENIGLSAADLENPAHVASGIEFILEGLHLSKMLNKDAVGDAGIYRSST
jgi:magnesium chelatase subunit I